MRSVLRPHVVSLLVYLGLLGIAGILAAVIGREPEVFDAMVAPRALGLHLLDWVMVMNGAWFLLFAFEFPLASGAPPPERRNRRVIAGCALFGLALFQAAVYVLAAGLSAQ